MNLNSTTSPNKKLNPIAWVPTLYFAMGMPFVVLNMVTSLMYKGLGTVSYTHLTLPTICSV